MSKLRLTDAKLRAAKPRESEYSLFDGNGLLCRVWPDGTRYWAFRYNFNLKRKKMGLGQYPALTLKDARARAAEYRALLQRD